GWAGLLGRVGGSGLAQPVESRQLVRIGDAAGRQVRLDHSVGGDPFAAVGLGEAALTDLGLEGHRLVSRRTGRVAYLAQLLGELLERPPAGYRKLRVARIHRRPFRPGP